MNADDLILFAQVVELGSFSKVADKNNLTNSVISKRISRLEKELNAPLLYRTTRRLTLTEAGQTLLSHAKTVQQAVYDAQNALSDYGDSISGTIRMSVPTISGRLVLADSIAEFCNQHPGIHIEMNLENRFVDLVEEGYDLVIRTGHLEDSSLIARHITDSQWVVCASPEYVASQGRPVTPSQLTKHNCLKYTYQTSGATEWQFKGTEGNYIVTVAGNFATDDASALRRATLGGRGIAYMPTVVVYDDIVAGTLIDLFPDQVAKKLGIYAVYPYSKHVPKKIQLLIEHIRQKYHSILHVF